MEREHRWYHSGIGPIPTFASMSGFLMDGEQECWHSNVPATFSSRSQRGSEALIIPTKTVWLTIFWTRQKPKEQECAFYHADFSLRLKNCPKISPPPNCTAEASARRRVWFHFFFFFWITNLKCTLFQLISSNPITSDWALVGKQIGFLKQTELKLCSSSLCSLPLYPLKRGGLGGVGWTPGCNYTPGALFHFHANAHNYTVSQLSPHRSHCPRRATAQLQSTF